MFNPFNYSHHLKWCFKHSSYFNSPLQACFIFQWLAHSYHILSPYLYAIAFLTLLKTKSPLLNKPQFLRSTSPEIHCSCIHLSQFCIFFCSDLSRHLELTSPLSPTIVFFVHTLFLIFLVRSIILAPIPTTSLLTPPNSARQALLCLQSIYPSSLWPYSPQFFWWVSRHSFSPCVSNHFTTLGSTRSNIPLSLPGLSCTLRILILYVTFTPRALIKHYISNTSTLLLFPSV